MFNYLKDLSKKIKELKEYKRDLDILNNTIIKELPELKISLLQYYLFGSKEDTAEILLMAYTLNKKVKKCSGKEPSKEDKVIDLYYKMERKYSDRFKNLETKINL